MNGISVSASIEAGVPGHVSGFTFGLFQPIDAPLGLPIAQGPELNLGHTSASVAFYV